MTKLLEKAIKDTIKKRKPTIGLKQIMHSITSSKLIVISQSVPNEKVKEVETNAKNNNVPTINFEGSSVALGKLCGLQFRVSAISLDSLSNTNTQAISPKKIIIYTSEQWKSKAYNLILKNVLDGQTNVGVIIRSLIANKDTEQIKKDPDFVKKILNDILSEPVELRKGRMDIGQIDEKQIISSELSSLVKNDYDVELSVFSESDSEKYDPKNKAKAARPFKPAILIE